MRSNGYKGDGIQGEITGKADVDTDELGNRDYDAADAMFGGKVYPHGGNPDNLKVIRGELLFYKKGQNDGIRPRVFSSFNGLYIHDASVKESLKRRFEFLGIAKGDYLYGGDNYDKQPPLDQPIGVVLAGSVQVQNMTNQDIFVGDPLEWDIPEFQTSSRITEFNSPAQPYAQNGTSQTPGKLIGFFKRCDFRDYSMDVDMIQALNKIPAGGEEPGIRGLTVDDILSEDRRNNLTPDQEEALGLKYGILAVMAMGFRLATRAGAPNSVEELLADADGEYFGMFQDSSDESVSAAERNAVSLLMGAVNAARMLKQSRIVARAGSSAGPGEDYVAILRS